MFPYIQEKIMNILRTHSMRWLLAIGGLMLLMTACATLNVSAMAVQPAPATSIPPGTTLLTAHTTFNVLTAAWSPDGKRLALGGTDGTVQVRDATTGTILFTVHGHATQVWAVAWSPDGKRLASASWDKTVQV